MVRKGRLALIILLVPLAALAIWRVVYRDVANPPPAQVTAGVGQALPAINLTDEIDGPAIPLQKVLVPGRKAILALWATWCEPCLREMPLMVSNIKRLKSEGVDVVLINYNGGLAAKAVPEVKAFLISQRFDVKTYFDFNNTLLDALSISTLPHAVAVGADGKIAWIREGELDWSDAELSHL